MDKMHRDRIAFLRVTSGRFERGMSAKHLRMGREVRLSHPHRFFGQERVSIDEAYPGDVIGLINPGMFRVGDALSSGKNFEVRNFPRFAPEIFAQVAPREPVLGAVGELQLEVFQTRLEVEYGVSLRLDRKGWTRARWVKDVTDEVLEILPMVVKDEADRFVALFNSDFEIDYAKSRYEGLELLETPPSEEDLG